jgi:MYXO-CTERM domain-containing protein
MASFRSSLGIASLFVLVGAGAACTETIADETRSGQAISQTFNRNNVVSDEELLDPEAYSEQQIQRFFDNSPYGKKSVLADYTVGGELASAIIHKAATTYGVNPLELVVRLQMEQSLVAKTTADEKTLSLAFGCGCPHAPICKTEPEKYTGFDKQAECAARTLKSSMDKLKSGEPTVSGWKKGVAKSTEDDIEVTPETNATASLYSYTPWAGEGAGGKTGVGGVHLHWQIWKRFDAAIKGETTTSRNNTPDAAADTGASTTTDGGTKTDSGSAGSCGTCSNPGFPVCDEDKGECVECLSSSACSSKGKVCDTNLGKCVECTTTDKTKCTAASNGTQCLSNLTCGCETDAHCGSATSGRICNDATKKCEAGCRNGTGCPAGQACSSTTSLIGECKVSADAGPPASDAGAEAGPKDNGPKDDGTVTIPGEDEFEDVPRATPSENAAPASTTVATGGNEELVEVGNGPDRRKKSSGGCTTAPVGNTSSSGALLGLGLALAAFVRRRRVG